MRIGARLGPFYASQRVELPRRHYRRGGGGNWLGWLVILAPIGWLMGQCDGHPHGYQPRQIAPPLAPMTTTAPTIPLRGGPGECGHPHSDECAPITTTTTPPTTWPSTHQEWMQYCATHIDTVECGNGSDVTPTTTAPMPAWPPGSGPCTVHPREAPEGCLPTTTPTFTPQCAPNDLNCQYTVPGVPNVPPGGTLPQGQVI